MLGSALLAACLAGCSPEEAPARPAGPAPSASPVVMKAAPEAVHAAHAEQAVGRARQKELMRLIFPGQPEQEDDVRFSVLRQSAQGEYDLMMFASAREYPDGRLVVVVNGSPASAEGDYESEHGAGSVSVYVLRRQAGKWSVSARHEHLVQTGSFGASGDVKWFTVGAGKEGFVVSGEYADIERNHVSGSAHVFAFAGDTVRYLGKVADLQDESDGCDADAGTCTDARGTPRFVEAAGGGQYHDLSMTFTGRRYTATSRDPDEKVEKVLAKIAQTARYRFNGKRYVPVSGANPIGEE